MRTTHNTKENDTHTVRPRRKTGQLRPMVYSLKEEACDVNKNDAKTCDTKICDANCDAEICVAKICAEICAEICDTEAFTETATSDTSTSTCPSDTVEDLIAASWAAHPGVPEADISFKDWHSPWLSLDWGDSDSDEDAHANDTNILLSEDPAFTPEVSVCDSDVFDISNELARIELEEMISKEASRESEDVSLEEVSLEQVSLNLPVVKNESSVEVSLEQEVSLSSPLQTSTP